MTDAGTRLRRAGYCPAIPLPRADELADEAAASLPRAELTETTAFELYVDGQDMRSPVRYRLAPPGPGLARLHESDALRKLASALLGTGAEPSKTGYLHYLAGDRIGVHTDLPSCELTLLVAVTETAPALVVHPELADLSPEELLRLAEEAGGAPAGGVAVPVERGVAVALYGGGLPHQTRPVARAEEGIVATLCYVGAP